MTTDINEWSGIEAVESIETSIEQDISNLSEYQKIEYIELLKEKLNKMTSLGTQPISRGRDELVICIYIA